MSFPHAPTGVVRLVLRLEGFAVVAVATWLYAKTGQSWLLYAALFFVPDVTFAAYLMNRQIGAIAYNIAHSYAVSLPVAAFGFALDNSYVLAIGLIATAHIGFDRALGYGLKYASGFKDTHLGQLPSTKS
jgi:hypothetical protein